MSSARQLSFMSLLAAVSAHKISRWETAFIHRLARPSTLRQRRWHPMTLLHSASVSPAIYRLAPTRLLSRHSMASNRSIRRHFPFLYIPSRPRRVLTLLVALPPRNRPLLHARGLAAGGRVSNLTSLRPGTSSRTYSKDDLHTSTSGNYRCYTK